MVSGLASGRKERTVTEGAFMTATVRKAVIPAAGLGTRFLPASKAQPKEMLPLVDKPAIQYVVEEAVRVGITDILVITGRGKRSLEDHFDRSFELEYYLERDGKTEALAEMRAIADMADIHYLRQGEPKGLGHAVGVAREHVGDEPFVVMLGDDIMDERSTVLADMIAAYGRTGTSIVALKEFPVEEMSHYGCAAVEPAGPEQLVRINRLVEKPAAGTAPSNLAVMGRYLFTPDIFGAIDATEPGKGGEYQLTDAMAKLMASPGVHGWIFKWGRYDVGNKLDYLRATVEFALKRPDLGPPFEAYLQELVRSRHLV
jgi:UTP--glucose-1-phosphate uridylyltransferase